MPLLAKPPPHPCTLSILEKCQSWRIATSDLAKSVTRTQADSNGWGKTLLSTPLSSHAYPTSYRPQYHYYTTTLLMLPCDLTLGMESLTGSSIAVRSKKYNIWHTSRHLNFCLVLVAGMFTRIAFVSDIHFLSERAKLLPHQVYTPNFGLYKPQILWIRLQ